MKIGYIKVSYQDQKYLNEIEIDFIYKENSRL